MKVDAERLHLIGVAGSGMLPLALMLREAGYQVQGTDPGLTEARRKLLLASGVTVLDRDDAQALADVDRVVASPAVPRHHPGLRAARRAGLETLSRSLALSRLLKGRRCICISGSHGKSTTTAMLIHILAEAEQRFGYFLGAEISAMPPARLGAPDAVFVLEACEAHGALRDWQPAHVVLTNLDDDHATHYGDQSGLEDAFLDFSRQTPDSGCLMVCGDDVGARRLAQRLTRPVVTYGFEPDNHLRAVEKALNRAEVMQDGQRLGDLSLRVPGRHNQMNALAALAMATGLGVAAETALAALSRFGGVDRRLQSIGPVTGPRLFDDFAHHPREIAASLTALRGKVGRVVAVLQPQLGSRIRDMAPAFAQALALADRRLVLPVETLGERQKPVAADDVLAQACADAGLEIERVGNLPDLATALTSDLRPDDTVVVMAGRSGDGLAQFLNAACFRQQHRPKAASSVVYGRSSAPVPCLPDSIAALALAAPDSTAVQIGKRTLSYGMLMARSRDLATLLRARGALAGQPVVVCLGSTVDRVVAFLAILRLGAVYLPIDPQQPPERVEWMLRASGTGVVVVNGASPAMPDLSLPFVNCGQITDRTVAPDDFLPLDLSPGAVASDSLAYLIFTSGSTGRPKGVEISHGAIANFAAAAARHFAIGPDARVSLVTAFGFDVSVGDMAMTLAAGGCLVLPTDLEASAGSALVRFVKEARLSHLSITPSGLSMMPPSDLPDLQSVIVVGEACHPSLVARWGFGRRFINAYGPTEATVEATFADCIVGGPVTIGRPIDNMGVCVLDTVLRPVPRGQEGELCLFGAGLARGYLNQPDLTAACFVPVTMPDGTVRRVYRTGDRAVMDDAGVLRFLGRLDEQFKFRGHRVEPAEVEAVLCDFQMIKDACVTKIDTDAGERLIAHVVLRPNTPVLDHTALKAHLNARLPRHMHPNFTLPLNDIARTANGKLDRSGLPLPPAIASPPAARRPGSPTELRLLEILRTTAAEVAIAGVRDSLGDAGLDSLGMANFIFTVEAEFGIELDLSLEDGGDTIEAVGIAVEQRIATQAPGPGPELGSQLAGKLRPHLASWPGDRKGATGLLRHLRSGPLVGRSLYWCFQSGEEFAALSDAIGDQIDLFGLRSGHMAFDYDPPTLNALATLYADEIDSVAADGPLTVGGNCQGGLVMAEVAKELRRRGRQVALTVLMEQGRFHPQAGKVLLLFGDRSYFNPYGQIASPETLFQRAYPDAFRVEMLPGGHGEYFNPSNVPALGRILVTQIKDALTGSDIDPIAAEGH